MATKGESGLAPAAVVPQATDIELAPPAETARAVQNM